MRRILAELPETLDETYERILQEIPKANRVHAHRLLQCLTVAFRPLYLAELAEVLAVDFDAAGGIPKLNEDLRWEDQEQAVLSACSSLIAIVGAGSSRVVQFSHFSVKEFLTSDRLATSTNVAARHCHILLEPSHTIMAQACLSVLLSNIDRYTLRDLPLARYASHYFGDHSEFGNVFAHIRDGIDDLLDADKPHFATWLWLRDVDDSVSSEQSEASPLYHIAGLGFRAMVDHLISKRPEDLSVRGDYGIPLHAALSNGHGDVALLLLGHCVDVDVRGFGDRTPLHMAVDSGLLEVTRVLIERGARINARDSSDRTPLHPTFDTYKTFDDQYFDVVRYLLEHGADVDTQANDENPTPLHLASYWGGFGVTQLLLDHGADIDVRGANGRTPLHGTLVGMTDDLDDHFFDALRFLLEHGADVQALDNDHATPLHVVSQSGGMKATRLLIEHGAVVDAQDNEGSTPLHVASQCSNPAVARLLLEQGANIRVRNKKDQTPQHLLLAMWSKKSPDDDIDTIRFFLERGADVDAVDENHSSLLQVALFHGSVNVAQLLLERGANINMRDGKGHTPLHGLVDIELVSTDYFFDAMQFLLERGADVDALNDDHCTPLHMASQFGNIRAAGLLLEHGANVHLQNDDGHTPSQVASAKGHKEITRLLSEHSPSEQEL